MTPTSINQVIDQLSVIIETCKQKGSRLGYFPALYKRVTIAVKNKLGQQYFEDDARMEKLDVVFANRYLQAYEDNQSQKPCTESWLVSFEAAKTWPPLVLQHLFLGMNAHISLDLGIAAATVCPGENIHALQNDFNKINEVLSSLVNEVQNELASIWPLLKPIDWFAGSADEKVADFSMNLARDAAWQVALQYASLTSQSEKDAYLKARDFKVATFGRKIYQPGILLRNVIRVLRAGEIGTISQKIGRLDGKEVTKKSLNF